ncbi:MAG TPA: DUF1648 domain-containing protein, partial [Holophagaceae bacterium]
MAHDVLPEGSGTPEPTRLTRDWPLWLLIALDWGVAAWSLPRLPVPTPLHWNLRGTVDRWGSPVEAAFLFPSIGLGVYLAALGMATFRRRTGNSAPSGMDRSVRWILVAFISGVHLALLMGLVRGDSETPRWLFLLLALLLMLLGNLLPRVEPGLRPSAPPETREIWRNAYRVSGRLLVGAGLLQACTFWLPPTVFAAILAGSTLLALLAPLLALPTQFRRIHAGTFTLQAGEEGPAGPLLSPHDGAAFAGLAGLLLLHRFLGPGAVAAPLRWAIAGLLAAWAVLLADAARPAPQEVR